MNENNFEKRIARGIWLVHFFSSLRELCKEQTAVIDRLSEKLESRRIRFWNIDVEKKSELAVGLGVASLPTIIVFKDGRESRRFIGLQGAGALERALLETLGS